MRSFMMTKGEDIEHFLFRLQSIRDQLTATGATVDDAVIVRTALNAVTDEWETFVQSILGRADLLDWDSLWSILQQEELRKFTKKQHSLGIEEAVEEEEGSFKDQVLPVWRNGTFCQPLSRKKEGQGSIFFQSSDGR